MKKHIYTAEQIKFLEENIKGCSRMEMTEIFNKHFDLELSCRQITTVIKTRRLNNGLDGKFKPGQIPYNKGKKGFGGWKPTQFKNGNKPWNYKPIGSERVNVDGYAEVKVADPKKWRQKHVLIWETANGSIPKGHVLIFSDRNKNNLELSNLLLISKQQLLALNKRNLIKNDSELTTTGIIIADICLKISDLKNEKNKRL